MSVVFLPSAFPGPSAPDLFNKKISSDDVIGGDFGLPAITAEH